MTSAKSNRTPLPLALEILLDDHREVEALFDQYEDQREDNNESRLGTAMQICKQLTLHAQVEEELFYPWLRKALPESRKGLIEEAVAEHADARKLVARIAALTSVDDASDAMVKALSEEIAHHVKEEEGKIFPEVLDRGDALDELGQRLAARKVELLEEVGLPLPGNGKQPPPEAESAARRRSAR